MSARDERRRRIVALILHRPALLPVSDEQAAREALGYGLSPSHPLNTTRGQVEEPAAARRSSDHEDFTG